MEGTNLLLCDWWYDSFGFWQLSCLQHFEIIHTVSIDSWNDGYEYSHISRASQTTRPNFTCMTKRAPWFILASSSCPWKDKSFILEIQKGLSKSFYPVVMVGKCFTLCQTSMWAAVRPCQWILMGLLNESTKLTFLLRSCGSKRVAIGEALVCRTRSDLIFCVLSAVSRYWAITSLTMDNLWAFADLTTVEVAFSDAFRHSSRAILPCAILHIHNALFLSPVFVNLAGQIKQYGSLEWPLTQQETQ